MRKQHVFCLFLALVFALTPALSHAGEELDLSVYSVVHLGDRKLVYQGPGKDYFRDGSAGVGATNDVRVYGTLGDWMMIGYVYSTDNFRVGCGNAAQRDGNHPGKGRGGAVLFLRGQDGDG